MAFLQSFSDRLQSYLSQDHHRRVTEHIGKQLSAEEVQQHPEFPHVNWDLKPEKREKIDVAKGRGGPFKLAYELHGRGAKKIAVCIPLPAQVRPCSLW